MLGSVCASVAASVTLVTQLPRKAPWFQNDKSNAAQGIWCREYTELRKYVLWVLVFLQVRSWGFIWKSLSLQLWGGGSLAEGAVMHKTGFLSTLPALPFPGPCVFLETGLFQGQRVCDLGKGRNTRVTPVGWSMGALLSGDTSSPAEQTPATNVGNTKLNSSAMLKQFRLL